MQSAHAAPSAPRPKVTVAQPAVASVADYSEHTGRTEAPDAVEIRPRANGYLTKATFHEGDLVKKGDLLFVVDPRPYEAALARSRAELGATRADLELANKELDRANQLFGRGTITQQQLDARTAQVSQLAAREALASASIQVSALDLEFAHVRSPISGRIGRMLVTPGNLVGPALPTPLATVVSIDPLYVYIDVDETRAMKLRKEGRAYIAFPGEDHFDHEAKIDFLDNRVDPNTGTLRVRAVVSNKDGHLAHGLFARVRLPEGEAAPVMMVADRAVATDQDRRYVWVIDPQGKAQYRAVTLGRMEGGLRVVRSGLQADDKVVVRGLQRVRAGTEVDVEQASMRELDKATASVTP
ncbi:MAG TPA: efflux RND transporter periplasmic adaptor subunit [Polyangiales bacterium]|nr:efflux RND transporter periplasmic adaptor subunit [Polyangiales bacterium]